MAIAVLVLSTMLLSIRRQERVQWDRRVVPIARFVEQARSLRFRHAVAVEFLSVDRFKAKVGEGRAPTAQDRARLDQAVGELRALGLVSGQIDLRALSTQLLQEGVIGLYVPRDKRVYVRGDQLTPAVRVTLAHELTHALQDQRVGLDRVLNSGRSTVAARTLIEADAMRVEDLYKASLPPGEVAAADQVRKQEGAAADLHGIPEVLVDSLAFPYVFGPAFVQALVSTGGAGAVDRAFKAPPDSEAQIVSPTRYLSGEKVEKVDPPTVPGGDARLQGDEEFGQVQMLEVIGARLPYDQAWRAVSGWRGDSSVVYSHAGKVCVAVTTAFSSPDDADAFTAAARSWASAVSGAGITPTGRLVELRSCDPGPAATAPAPDPSPFKVLSIRAGILGGLVRAGAAPAIATCTADGVIRAVGASQLATIDLQGDPDPDQLAGVRAAVQQVTRTCASGRA